ncbi:hypothetical protein MNB_SV-6-675 [hydrothermal vent metagenome]|uniref:Peptidoglycan binding-like domain-containing protein n=1 Tax=hydrothermal vent metagenome TaxID=652676 RepID=A0A1W1BU25_9ZZZZ
MVMKKIYAIVLGLMLTTQVVSARNNAALFGVAAAAIAGAAILANSHKPHRHHYVPRRGHHKKRSKKVVVTDEMKIQKSLKYLDFYHGKIDGKINSYATRTAIKKMNREYGLDNGTSLDKRTWDQLIYLSELFQMDKDLFAEGSSKKTEGKRLQTALKVYGVYNGKVDGIVGSGTRKSISLYKSEEGLGSSTHLSSNERYNLIDSAQKMNSEAIDEAIASLSQKKRRVVRSTKKETIDKDRGTPTRRAVKKKTKDTETLKEKEDIDEDELDDMQKALDSIDNENSHSKKSSETEGFN